MIEPVSEVVFPFQGLTGHLVGVTGMGYNEDELQLMEEVCPPSDSVWMLPLDTDCAQHRGSGGGSATTRCEGLPHVLIFAKGSMVDVATSFALRVKTRT